MKKKIVIDSSSFSNIFNPFSFVGFFPVRLYLLAI